MNFWHQILKDPKSYASLSGNSKFQKCHLFVKIPSRWRGLETFDEVTRCLGTYSSKGLRLSLITGTSLNYHKTAESWEEPPISGFLKIKFYKPRPAVRYNWAERQTEKNIALSVEDLLQMFSL